MESWAPFAYALTHEEASRVSHGDYSQLRRPFEPEWKVGELVNVASNLWIRPARAKFFPTGHRISFSVQDFRPTFVRRVPAIHEPPVVDDMGFPIPHDNAAIAAATVDGNYTAAHELAVPEDDEALDVETARKYSRAATQRFANLRSHENRQRQVAQLSGKLKSLQKRAESSGVDLTEQIDAIEAALADAESLLQSS